MFPESAAPEGKLPWERPSRRAAPSIPHLVLVWSLDEPERIGEAIPVSGPSSVGRGDSLPEDPAPRVMLQRMRPALTESRAPIANARIARLHLFLEPQGEGVRIRSYGRAPMRVNGQNQQDALVRDGDVVELHNAAVFVVVSRPGELSPLRSAGPADFAFGSADRFGITGESEAVWRLRDELGFAAATDRHVLLLGDSGVGKELAARAIHGLSSRRDRPLISRNAATLPDSLVDAELFGNAKNYPNAGMPERGGLIGEAHGSTLFLDEIGELPERSQVHLLRVLDAAGEYQRLGEATPSHSSFRLVAATNRPLDALKHDFLARFTHRIKLPGLMDRPEDIALVLAELLRRIALGTPHVVSRFFERRDGELAEPRIAPDLIVRLLRHPFTHHVRELDRLLWLAIGSAEDDYIGVTEPVDAELKDDTKAAQDAAEVSREQLLAALREHGRSPTRIAKALGLKNRYVLHRLLKKHGLGASALDDAGSA